MVLVAPLRQRKVRKSSVLGRSGGTEDEDVDEEDAVTALLLPPLLAGFCLAGAALTGLPCAEEGADWPCANLRWACTLGTLKKGFGG